MATLTRQQITPAGLAPSYAAATGGGDKVAPGPTTFIQVKNAGGAGVTVTIDDPTSQAPAGSAGFNPDVSVVVPATTGDRMIGPIPEGRFAAIADGLAAIAYSQVTSVTVGAFYL